jgi:hypothetical protein
MSAPISILGKIDITQTVNEINVTLPVERQPVQFYAHVGVRHGRIMSISRRPQAGENMVSIPIDKDLAEDFTSGKKRPGRWLAIKRGDEYILMDSRDLSKLKYERVEGLVMQEVPEEDSENVDIRVEIGKVPDAVLIHFNGERISRWKEPAKLYFTAEGNPTFLKCAFSLDVNIMNEITAANGLSEWPNPLVLHLPQAEDTSVYTAKSNIKMVIIRHEASNHRV